MTDEIIPPLKRCPKCGLEKPLTAEFFHRNKSRKSGFHCTCIPCKTYDWRLKQWLKQGKPLEEFLHLEDMHAKGLKCCASGENCLSANGPWLPATREYFYARKISRDGLLGTCILCSRKISLDWQRKDPSGMQRRAHNFAINNRDKKSAASRNRHAKKKNAGGKHTSQDVALQIKAQTNSKDELICWWCGKVIKGKYHVDHRIPIDRQGSNSAGNLVIAHIRCNLSKHNKLPWEWNGRLL